MAILLPLVNGRVFEAALGRDREAVIRVQRVADDGFRSARAVRVRRIDEIDAEIDCATQQLHGVRARRTEATLFGQADRPDPQPRDRDLAVQSHGRRRRSRRPCHARHVAGCSRRYLSCFSGIGGVITLAPAPRCTYCSGAPITAHSTVARDTTWCAGSPKVRPPNALIWNCLLYTSPSPRDS